MSLLYECSQQECCYCFSEHQWRKPSLRCPRHDQPLAPLAKHLPTKPVVQAKAGPDRWSRQLSGGVLNEMAFMARVKMNFTPPRFRIQVTGCTRLNTLGNNVFHGDRPPRRERACLKSWGTSMLIQAFACTVFGWIPAGQTVWPRETVSVGPMAPLNGESLKLLCRKR